MQQAVIQQGRETSGKEHLLHPKRLPHQHTDCPVALPRELHIRIRGRPIGPQLGLELKESVVLEETLHHLLEKFPDHAGAACHLILKPNIQAPSDVRLLFILPVSQEVLHDVLGVPPHGEHLVGPEAILIRPIKLLRHVNHKAPPPEGHRDQGGVGEEGAEIPGGLEGLGEQEEIGDTRVPMLPPPRPLCGFLLLINPVEHKGTRVNLGSPGAGFSEAARAALQQITLVQQLQQRHQVPEILIPLHPLHILHMHNPGIGHVHQSGHKHLKMVVLPL
mmetsp:Transcript_68579/g.157432  ORF Transcript_68579/g.157432 Transcript_68579/m.157432 type:complete len:276 (+) Transcript_68579:765-1592(+)